MKYYIGKLEERNGEYEYEHPILVQMDDDLDPMEWLENYAHEFYGDDTEPLDGGYYFFGGGIFVSAAGVQEMTEEEYAVMKKFGI